MEASAESVLKSRFTSAFWSQVQNRSYQNEAELHVVYWNSLEL